MDRAGVWARKRESVYRGSMCICEEVVWTLVKEHGVKGWNAKQGADIEEGCTWHAHREVVLQRGPRHATTPVES
eukprot:61286-Chlamydomonas_euryale.AAC.1